jgi:AraC-like DNA-binding protein
VAVLDGEAQSRQRIEGRLTSAVARSGVITVAPAGRDAWRQLKGTVEVSNVFLRPARLRAFADEIGSPRPVELLDRLNVDDPTLFTILKMIGEEAGSSEPLSRLMIERLLDLACMQVLRAHAVFAPGTAGARPGLAKWQVRRVTAYMRDRLGDEIGLQELAGVVGLSRWHFCTAFRQATGYSPHRWLARVRMERARELLSHSALGVTDIALAVGYDTASAFASAFRRHVGLSPSQYRRSL